MKQLTISVPVNKFQFIVDLLSNLNFVTIDKSDKNYVMTEEQLLPVREEYKKADENPDYALDWDEVKDQFKVD